jgi:exosome complex RNA-binding protein Rrp42 (RNase PH superfamily)
MYYDMFFSVANLELLPLCSSKFKQGAPSPIAQSINAWLNGILHGSNVGQNRQSVKNKF